jgi:Polysaccharide deacetylase
MPDAGPTSAAAILAHVGRYQQPTNTGVVAFRFDDGPLTDLILARLSARRGIPVELAIPTAWIGHRRRLGASHLRALVRAGHTIASHSYDHGLPPRDMRTLVANVRRANDDFAALGIPVWTFVQPGPWGGGGPGSLDSRARALALDEAFRDRFVCLEGYATESVLPAGRVQEARLGLSHVTIDDASWIELRNCVTRVIEGPGFVQFVAHTAKCVKTLRGASLAWRIWRLLEWCGALQVQGRLRCRSVLSALGAFDPAGESLLGDTELGFKAVLRPRESLVPGLPYRLEWGPVAASSPAPTGVRVRKASGESAQRLRFQREVGWWVARFGVLEPGEWVVEVTPESRRPNARIALYVG